MALKRPRSTAAPSRKRMVIIGIIALFLGLMLLVAMRGYYWVFGSNVITAKSEAHYLYLPPNATFDEAIQLLEREKILVNQRSFLFVAKLMGYDQAVKAGRYKVTSGMSNHTLVSMLRSGNQSAVNVTFHEIRTKERLAQIVSQKILADSSEIVQLLNNDETLKTFGFSKETVLALFIPNTYQIYWNTNAEQFILRIKKEYDKFWDNNRREKAASIVLSPIEVSILASIIDEETNKNDEKPTIAGVYLNRLKIGMPLQACPTVKFAMGDFTVKRVLDSDLLIDSPYNTYQHTGLPPGPIRMPSVASIDAVLSPEKHDYLFMCAKEDFSGYHNFAKTLAQHNRNSAKYSQALAERKIWR